MQARSTAQILKIIGCKHLELVKVNGSGYWYFKFDDGHSYETESVYTPKLSDMTVLQWVEVGAAFVKECVHRYE